MNLYTIWEKANRIFRTFFIIHEHSFSRDCSRECSANIHEWPEPSSSAIIMVLPEQQFEVNTISKTFSLRELGIKIGWGSSILISIALKILLTYCCVSPVISNCISEKWRKFKTTKWTNIKFINSGDPTVHLETVPLQDIEAIPSSYTPFTPLSPFAMLIKNLTSGKPMAPTTELNLPNKLDNIVVNLFCRGEC